MTPPTPNTRRPVGPAAAACVALLFLVASPTPSASQPTCVLPVSAYVTDEGDVPLDGSIDFELRFYVDDDPGSTAVECRSLADVSVEQGWLRLLVDACADPAPRDCGVSPLTDLVTGADSLRVGLRVGEAADELSPRMPIGAAPYAIRAADAATLDGLSADAFERAGNLVAHTAAAGPHHSASSDGIDITPRSVNIGGSSLTDGTIDLGSDADDALTAEMVRTFTTGGDADALHGHAGGAGETGCYHAWGVTTCGEDYSAMYAGVAAMPYLREYSAAIGTSDILCVETTAISGYDDDTGLDGMGVATVRDGLERILLTDSRLS